MISKMHEILARAFSDNDGEIAECRMRFPRFRYWKNLLKIVPVHIIPSLIAQKKRGGGGKIVNKTEEMLSRISLEGTLHLC